MISTKSLVRSFSFTISYLKDGTGCACAGHSNAKLSSLRDLNPLESSVVGNLGDALPAGS